MAEKTEKATPKKLRDARKKGQVAKVQDVPASVTFIVSISLVMGLSTYLYGHLSSYLITIFKIASTNIDMENRAAGYLAQCMMVIITCSLPIMVPTAIAGVLAGFLVVGPLFSLESMKPDLKRLNPVTNIKNIFKMKTLFELLKSIFKITGASVLIYSVVWNSLDEIIATAAMPVLGSAIVFSSFLVKVIIRVGIFFLFIAMMDFIFQRKQFSKEMKMEKFEVKQEYRDTEGDPHIKGKRKQAAHEIAYQEGPSGVKRARAVITNPIHIAVAVEYDETNEPAPRIVTMGQGSMADLIIKAAQEYNVPIMRNVALAHTLFEKGKISEYIPEDTYQAVAEILKWLSGIEPGADYNVELFK